MGLAVLSLQQTEIQQVLFDKKYPNSSLKYSEIKRTGLYKKS